VIKYTCSGRRPVKSGMYILRTFENTMLRKRMWAQEEVTEGCRKLHIEDLHNLYPLSNIIQNNRMKEDEMSWKCNKHEAN
jgi:hypothetical protein